MDHDISTKGIKPGNEKLEKAPQNPFGSSQANSAGVRGAGAGEEDVNKEYDRIQQDGDPLTLGQKGVKP